MEGTLDAAGNTLALFGVVNDPMTGVRDKLMGYLPHFFDRDHHRFEIRDDSLPPEGVPLLELAYAGTG